MLEISAREPQHVMWPDYAEPRFCNGTIKNKTHCTFKDHSHRRKTSYFCSFGPNAKHLKVRQKRFTQRHDPLFSYFTLRLFCLKLKWSPQTAEKNHRNPSLNKYMTEPQKSTQTQQDNARLSESCLRMWKWCAFLSVAAKSTLLHTDTISRSSGLK